MTLASVVYPRLGKSSPYYGSAGRHKTPGGVYVAPQGYGDGNGDNVSATANRCFYIPFAVENDTVFSGVGVINGDTAASGQKMRAFVVGDDVALTAGPAVVKDFGEVTFGATAIANVLSSSWSAAAGLYWMALWFNSATVMRGMMPLYMSTNVGFTSGLQLNHIHGTFSFTAAFASLFAAHYVDTAYGATPATAVAPTATLVYQTATTSIVPLFKLKT